MRGSKRTGNRPVKARTKGSSETKREREREKKINPQPSFLVINHSADISKVRAWPMENPRDERYGMEETFPVIR